MKTKLILIAILAAFSCSRREPVLHPALLELYGGVDLGMKEKEAARKLRKIAGSDRDWISGYIGGIPKADSSFKLAIGTYSKYFLDPSLVRYIAASFTEEYIHSGGDTTLAYWLDYFEGAFGEKPIHLFRYDSDHAYIERDEYNWLLGGYKFMLAVWPDEDNPNPLYFEVSTNTEMVNDYLANRYYKVTENGDTLKY